MENQFYKLKVVDTKHPIRDAITVTLEIPTALKNVFQYASGQYLTLEFELEGTVVRRSYSLNSCPYTDEQLSITVKRVDGGLVSNHINDTVVAGTILSVAPPQGKFKLTPDPSAYKSYFLFSAGSGITPIISMIQSILHVAKESTVYLFYGNLNQDTIIFKDELNQLVEQYGNKRFKLIHTLSAPKVWTTWKQWDGRKGRIDGKAVEWFINEYPPIAQQTEYYICGPGAMNISVRKTLLELGIPKTLIHLEQFGALPIEDESIPIVDQAALKAKLNGTVHELNISKGKTILQTMKRAGVSPPHFCESGVCGSCVATVKKGKAVMKACMALDENDIEQGKILTCQAVPTTEKVEIVF